LASYPALDLQHAVSPADRTLQDLLYAELDTFEPVAIDEQDDDRWRVFFRTPAMRDAAQAAITSALGDRLRIISPVDVDDEDWARRSQAALKAIHAGRIIVAPPWDVPPAGGEIVIVIDPSMGFGTGHHATTRLCLELLQDIDVRGKRVIDVGTGSGVLALAAWKLGASRITAVDHDPDALQNARENVERNGAAGAIDIVEADLSTISGASHTLTSRADVVLANLTGAVLQRYARVLRAMLEPAGTLIVSGFSPSEMVAVVRAITGPVERSMQDGEWAAAVITSVASH
jgi:ribosomal protein L11 methyltransferase